MGILVEDPTVQIIPGAILVREISTLGVRGDQLPLGVANRSYLYDCADLPADNAVEFRGEVLSHSFPPGIFRYYDDGSFAVDAACPDGTYSFTFRLYADGVAQAPLITNYVIIGASGSLTIQSSADSFLSGLGLSVLPAPTLTIVGGLDAFAAAFSLGTAPSLTLSTEFGSFLSVIPLQGDIAGTVPDPVSADRQYVVNPDAHLDAYAIQNQFALSWEKDPDASLDYSIEWGNWLPPGDSIANMYVTTSSGVQVTAQALRGSLTAVVARGGVDGAWEFVTIRIVTALGRIDERTIQLLIRQR